MISTGISSKSGKAGSFQAMGLNGDILKGILRMGYKIPTPVQRKALPLALAGLDMVCMARTGSGKTCVFLLPLVEKLKAHDSKSGVRAIVLSPTRELAMQTFKFARDMAKFTDLRIISIVGGDGIEAQFDSLSSRPDIIIATPGRLMHHLREISTFKLKSVQYLVFDEADRLFEMGFAEQLNEIIKECPENRQTLLFSATLPKQLIQFSRAGLRDPQLIRLDTDTKMSEDLRMAFFSVRSCEKIAALLYLMRHIIPSNQLTIIFTATRHHSEFLHALFQLVGITSTLVYGSMDQDARTMNLRSFRNGDVSCMIVTDLAARGIDVPLLDNVINFHFPTSPKLFVHRCGRAARQGRTGYAFSIVEPEELSYMGDIHTFLGKDVTCDNRSNNTTNSNTSIIETEGSTLFPDSEASKSPLESYTLQTMIPSMIHTGLLPQDRLEIENELLKKLLSDDIILFNLFNVSENAMKQYRRTRTEATHTGVKMAKKLIKLNQITFIHPLIIGEDPEHCTTRVIEKTEFIKHLQSFRPQQTILETGIGTGMKSTRSSEYTKMSNNNTLQKELYSNKVMKALRSAVASGLERNKRKRMDDEDEMDDTDTDINTSSHHDVKSSSSLSSDHTNIKKEEDDEDLEIQFEDDEYQHHGNNSSNISDHNSDTTTEDHHNNNLQNNDTNLVKIRISRNERKKIKKAKKNGQVTSIVKNTHLTATRTTTDPSSDSIIQLHSNTTTTTTSSTPATTNFKDRQYYMTYGNEDAVAEYTESMMQPMSGLKSSETSNVRSMEKAFLDVIPDDALELNRKKRLLRWDAKKRKFVKQSLEEMANSSKGAKRVRTESGALAMQSSAPQGELYRKWKLKSHREITSTPEDNDNDDDYRMRPKSKVNLHVKEELKNAQQIRKQNKEKQNMKLKNMNKDKRKTIIGKMKQKNSFKKNSYDSGKSDKSKKFSNNKKSKFGGNKSR